MAISHSMDVGILLSKSKNELVRMLLESRDINIPVDIFSKESAPLESLVYYLKENLHMSVKDISFRLNRNVQTIWTTYRLSKNLSQENKSFLKIGIDSYNKKIPYSNITIPLSIFSKKNDSILESLVYYLHEYHNLSFVSIARLIKRNVKTVWTCYSRSIQKGGKK